MTADDNQGSPFAVAAVRSAAACRCMAAVRHWAAVFAAYPRSAPCTCGYVVLLLVTTTVLRHVRAATAATLLAASSTDVAHLVQDPVTVLVASAIWLPGRSWWPYAVVFMLVLAPMERRFGAARAISVVLSGHVLATLLTELPLAAAIALHLTASSAAHRMDVGASYGMFAAVGAGIGALPKNRRILAVAAVTTWLLCRAGYPPGMTSAGHLLSLAIGASWWRVLHHEVGETTEPARAATSRERPPG